MHRRGHDDVVVEAHHVVAGGCVGAGGSLRLIGERLRRAEAVGRGGPTAAGRREPGAACRFQRAGEPVEFQAVRVGFDPDERAADATAARLNARRNSRLIAFLGWRQCTTAGARGRHPSTIHAARRHTLGTLGAHEATAPVGVQPPPRSHNRLPRPVRRVRHRLPEVPRLHPDRPPAAGLLPRRLPDRESNREARRKTRRREWGAGKKLCDNHRAVATRTGNLNMRRIVFTPRARFAVDSLESEKRNVISRSPGCAVQSRAS